MVRGLRLPPGLLTKAEAAAYCGLSSLRSLRCVPSSQLR
jgi:hypothetical protein